jgi:DNA-binding SARP family transcriptional activator
MLDVRLFGKFNISLDGEAIEIPSRPMQSLLAFLILNSGTTFRREQLAGLLWPDSDEKNARGNLRQTLWRLGKAVGKHYFLTDKVSVGFNPQAENKLDVEILQNGAAEAVSTDQIEKSISVYTDALLPGFYDSWILLEQERLQAIFERCMRRLLDRLVRNKQWQAAREWAESWIAKGSVPEAAFRALMWAHAGLGDQAGVQAVYRRCVEALEKEVGVAPSAETQALFRKISSGEDLPELQEAESNGSISIRLPAQPTPFVGRKNDLKEIGALLSNPDIRLINIQGLGGIGKTRLAIEAAQTQQKPFADGVFFVPLAALDDPKLIGTSISTAIQFSIQAQNQRDEDPLNKQLMSYLRDKQMLLVLDNLEHLMEGLSIISDLHRFTDHIMMLTTSRQRLNLRGETVYALDALPVPKNRVRPLCARCNPTMLSSSS